MADTPSADTGTTQSQFIDGIPGVDIVVDKLVEQFDKAVTVRVFNRTNETLILTNLSREGDGVSQGEFAKFPAPDIAPGEEDEFAFGKELGVEVLANEFDCEGFVEYAVGSTGKTWRVEWENPVDPFRDPKATAQLLPDAGEFQSPPPLVGDGKNAPVSAVLRHPAFVPGGGAAGGITSRCIITVTNQTDSVLTLVDQGHHRGGFLGSPLPTLDPGESDNFASVETQGVTDPALQGSAGFVQYRIEAPGGGFWTSTWDNPERAQNSSTSEVEQVPEGMEFTALDQIGEGEENVPVTFILSGGPVGPVEEDEEWAPPVEVEQPTLRRGDDNPDGWVEYLQQLLNDSGNPVAVDGDFGPGTEAAVRRVQKDFDIQVDGIVGNQTWAVLRGERPVPASTDGRAPHSHVEGGVEARWYAEGSQGTGYFPDEDTVWFALWSVGTVLPDGHVATMRFTGNDSGEVDVMEVPITDPIAVHPEGGAEYRLQVAGLTESFGAGVHTVEAYLPAELGGDYITFQIRIE
jgi:Putative peptidoglycan binding domain